MILGVTGHRPDKLNNEYDMNGPMSLWISNEIDQTLKDLKPQKCICGMALGVDTIFAINCLFHAIPLIAAIPFKGQEKKWPEKSQEIYNKILSHELVEVVYVNNPGYASWKMQKRNEYIVNNCNILLAIWDGSEGGTGNCIGYATSIKKEILIIDPINCFK